MSTRGPTAWLGGQAWATDLAAAGAMASTALRRLGLYLITSLLTALLALPALWFALPPFRPRRTMPMSTTGFAAHNVRRLFADAEAIGSLRGAVLLAAVVIVLAFCCGAIAAVLLPRSTGRGADLLVYLTSLLCSVVVGTAGAMPIFLGLRDLNLIDSQLSVLLVLSGSLLPATMFMLADFVAALPRWRAQASRGLRPGRARLLATLTRPFARRGVVLVALLAVINAWGSLLAPLLLSVSGQRTVDPVVLYTFAAGDGHPDLRLLARFTLIYSGSLVVMYLLLGRTFGFRRRRPAES